MIIYINHESAAIRGKIMADCCTSASPELLEVPFAIPSWIQLFSRNALDDELALLVNQLLAE